MLLSSFSLIYLKEIRRILDILACANHEIVFKKEYWQNGYDFFSI